MEQSRRYLRLEAVMAHPDYHAMAAGNVTDKRIEADLAYAVDIFNEYHSDKTPKFVCVDYSFDISGTWRFNFLIEVFSESYTYSSPLLRMIATRLSNDCEWSDFTTVKKRLFSVTKVSEVSGGMLNREQEQAESVSTDIAIAKIEIEVIGAAEIIEAVKALVENAKNAQIQMK